MHRVQTALSQQSAGTTTWIAAHTDAQRHLSALSPAQEQRPQYRVRQGRSPFWLIQISRYVLPPHPGNMYRVPLHLRSTPARLVRDCAVSNFKLAIHFLRSCESDVNLSDFLRPIIQWCDVAD